MLNFRPLCPGFGLETDDVDLGDGLTDETFAEVERAFYAGQLLVLRGQSLTPAQFVAFAKRLGPPEPHVIDQFHHPADANILILSNVRKNGAPTGLQDAGSYFHTDYSYLQVPARATTLYSITVPRAGGHTLFANQQAAYDDLPAGDEKAHRAADRDPPLRQSARHRRPQPHRGVAIVGRAESQDAGDHAPDRAAASGHRAHLAVRGFGQFIRHCRHADDEARSCSTSWPRIRRRRNTATAWLTASATSSSGTTHRCCMPRR